MRRIAVVCREPSGESLRYAQAVGELDDVQLLLICDVHDSAQLIEAARRMAPDALVTPQERLLEPVAIASEALALPGMSVATVRRAIDKSLFKRALSEGGVGTARDRVVWDAGEARDFAAAVGYPIVLKPLKGYGGLATWRIRTPEELEIALQLTSAGPMLAEEHLPGAEVCVDTITIDGEPRFHSLCTYQPAILDALENPRIQWRCIMPRDLGGYARAVDDGLRAVRALAVGNAVTHMEGFLLPDGSVRFTDATLRPAGARIGPMLAFACDVDPYRVWARAAVDGRFDGPWERKYAVGTIFLRGGGEGFVEEVEGIDAVRLRLGAMIADARLPRAGRAKSATYTGDGYITVRHPETRAVESALDFIADTIHIHYSETSPPPRPAADQWRQRLHDVHNQLYRPSWDYESAQRGRNCS